MLDVWTGEVVGTMHIHGITVIQLAKKLGVSRGFVSNVLNGKKPLHGAEERFKAALMELIEEQENAKNESA